METTHGDPGDAGDGGGGGGGGPRGAAAAGGAPGAVGGGDSLPELSADAAAEAIAGGALLVDVREDHEWVAGHAPMALHVPLGELPDRIGELPTDRAVVCVCHLGGRSSRATAALRGQGVDALNLAGGMVAWAAAGHPVVDDEGGPGIVV